MELEEKILWVFCASLFVGLALLLFWLARTPPGVSWEENDKED